MAPLIVPSMLAADQSRLADDVIAMEDAGADRVQWDVMDGHFVPALTIGPDVVSAARAGTTIPFEAHLMVADPDPLLHQFVEAGCDVVIVHAEACTHLHRTLARIRELGARSGVALNPHTPAETVAHVLDVTDMVLAMTVNPGFCGQAYLPAVEPKIRALRSLIQAHGGPVELEVDGGITDATIAGAAAAGADVFISGSWLRGHRDGPAAAVRRLRDVASEARTSRPAVA